MDAILSSSESTYDRFSTAWSKYEPAIIEFSVSSKNKSAALKKALKDANGDPGTYTK